MSIPERAAALGYTVPVTVTTATDEMYGYIKPDTMTGDTFDFYEDDTGEEWTIKGWLAETNLVDEAA